MGVIHVPVYCKLMQTVWTRKENSRYVCWGITFQRDEWHITQHADYVNDRIEETRFCWLERYLLALLRFCFVFYPDWFPNFALKLFIICCVMLCYFLNRWYLRCKISTVLFHWFVVYLWSALQKVSVVNPDYFACKRHKMATTLTERACRRRW